VRKRLGTWWPLAAIVLLAAALRFATLDLQSFWYDEAFTPVHVLHASLAATLRGVARTENTPPLWYLLIWIWSRLFGSGEVALRSLSALAGVLTVPVAWAIGRELVGERVALTTALFVAVNPLFVWYSQEARAYALFVLTAALALLCFLHALHKPTPARLAAFALAGALALLSHYFAVFLLIPMCLWLLYAHRAQAGGQLPVVVAAVACDAVVGLALVPLIVAQGGHGTQWIGRWPLAERLEAIPQYYLTGESGAPLGHGIELLVALPILAGVLYGLWRGLTRFEERRALIMLVLAAAGVLIPLLLVGFGLDYLAPRNLVAAMLPLSALLAVVIVAQRTGRVGLLLAGFVALGFLAISLDVDLSPRLQRGDWRGLAHALAVAQPLQVAQPSRVAQSLRVAQPSRVAQSLRAITTPELGSAPLEYYLPPLHYLPAGAIVRVREIDETGYAPLRPGAEEPPAPGFQLVQRRDINGIVLYRFLSSTPRAISEATLREAAISQEHPEVLVP
jgi:mannosyltransferase